MTTSLFELVCNGENAFHITVTNFYTIDFIRAPEIQSILGFESNVLEKRVDNPRRYFLSIVQNQIVVTNDTVRHVLSMLTGYYTFSEFIEDVGSEMVNVLPLVSMTIEEEYVKYDIIGELGYLDRVSNDTTMNGFGQTPWFKLSPQAHNLSIESHGDCYLFDSNDPFLPDVTNDQGLGGHANLDPFYVEYGWQLCTSDYRFILIPFETYTMANSDDSLFSSSTFYMTEDTTMSLTMNLLMTSCINELNS